MTAVDHAELKRAEALLESRCKAIDLHYGRFPDSADRTMEDTAKAIRLVLSEIEGLKAERDEANANGASHWSRAIEAERQLAALHTQAPDSWRPDRLLRAIAEAPQPREASGKFLAAVASVNAYVAELNARAALRPQTAESGMLEKIERAILSCDAPCDDYFNRDVGMLLSVNPETATAIARVALLAMREPDLEALTPGLHWPPSAAQDFTAMIDAILAEPAS